MGNYRKQKTKYAKQRTGIRVSETKIPFPKLTNKIDVHETFEGYTNIIGILFDYSVNPTGSQELGVDLKLAHESCKESQQLLLDGMKLLRFAAQPDLPASEWFKTLDSVTWLSKVKKILATKENKDSAGALTCKK